LLALRFTQLTLETLDVNLDLSSKLWRKLMKFWLWALFLLTTAQVGCSADPTTSLAPVIREMRVVGATESSNGEYHGVITITNTSRFRVELGIVRFSCAVPLKLFSPDGMVAWDQALESGGRPGGCKWLPGEIELSRGESILVRSEKVSASVLRASLPPGVYRAELSVIFARMVPHETIAGALTTQVDTVISVFAGEVRLD
jgi:hypothetical protein